MKKIDLIQKLIDDFARHLDEETETRRGPVPPELREVAEFLRMLQAEIEMLERRVEDLQKEIICLRQETGG